MTLVQFQPLFIASNYLSTAYLSSLKNKHFGFLKANSGSTLFRRSASQTRRSLILVFTSDFYEGYSKHKEAKGGVTWYTVSREKMTALLLPT